MAKPEADLALVDEGVGTPAVVGKLDSEKPIGGMLILQKDIGQEIRELRADVVTDMAKARTKWMRAAALEFARMAAGVAEKGDT